MTVLATFDFRVMLLCGCLAAAPVLLARAAGEAPADPAGSADVAAPAAVRPLPPWVVLVLKPVSDNRVQPVTGVVISALGMVLVPFDFAGPGDQLVVLDGGTDFVANGRAARVHRQFPAAGLSVLQVTDLRRGAAAFSSSWPGDGDPVRLAAFPPAEMIVQGAAPLWSEARLAVSPAGEGNAAAAAADYRLSADSRLPNVTGPLLDGCGHWFGFSAAQGVQSMETERAPAYTFRTGLAAVLDQLNIAVPQLPCDPPLAATDSAPAAEVAVAETEQRPGEIQDVSGVLSVPDPADAFATTQGTLLRRFGWLLVLPLVLLAGLGVVRYRRSHTRSAAGAVHPPVAPPQHATEAVPANASPPEPPPDCLLEIRGRMPDGSAFTRSCKVHAAAVHVVIGRSSGNILIDSAEVHREHAVLAGSADQLTVSDLGSASGTWINRVPCLTGEIMFIEPEDTLFVGDVSFQISVTSHESERNGQHSGR